MARARASLPPPLAFAAARGLSSCTRRSGRRAAVALAWTCSTCRHLLTYRGSMVPCRNAQLDERSIFTPPSRAITRVGPHRAHAQRMAVTAAMRALDGRKGGGQPHDARQRQVEERNVLGRAVAGGPCGAHEHEPRRPAAFSTQDARVRSSAECENTQHCARRGDCPHVNTARIRTRGCTCLAARRGVVALCTCVSSPQQRHDCALHMPQRQRYT